MGDADESYDFSDIDRFVKKFREGGKWEIAQRLAINDLSRVNIDALVAELKEESRELAN